MSDHANSGMPWANSSPLIRLMCAVRSRTSRLRSRCDRLCGDILSRKAQTIAGLAGQTLAVTMAAADLWVVPLPDNESHERAFIEAVL